MACFLMAGTLYRQSQGGASAPPPGAAKAGPHDDQRVTVTWADALLVGSAADVALTVTVAGDGTRRGAV
jgi:hypothetical protein